MSIKKEEIGDEVLWEWRKEVFTELEAEGESTSICEVSLPNCLTETYLFNVLAQTSWGQEMYCPCGKHIVAIGVFPSKFWPDDSEQRIRIFDRKIPAQKKDA